MTLPRSPHIRLTATGLAWFILAAYLIAAGIAEWVSEPREYILLVGPAFGLLALLAAFGLIAGKAFTRGVVFVLAGLGLIGVVFALATFARAGFSLRWSYQFVLAALGLFFGWSLALVLWLWPARRAPRVAAG